MAGGGRESVVAVFNWFIFLCHSKQSQGNCIPVANAFSQARKCVLLCFTSYGREKKQLINNSVELFVLNGNNAIQSEFFFKYI